MSVFQTLKINSETRAEFRRALTRYDRAKVNPLIAVRNTVAVVIPMAVGAAWGHPALGMVGSLGALNVAYSDGTDPYALRARRMLLSSVICAIALFVGGLTRQDHPLAVAIAAAWAFAAGLMVALGTTAADLGTISLVTLVVFAAKPLPPGQQALSGLLALGGGLLQTGISLLFWPVRRYGRERELLSDVYEELARLAGKPVQVGTAPLGTAEFTTAQQMLVSISGEHTPESERFSSLLSQAERIRLRMLTLGRLRRRLERTDPEAAPVAILQTFLAACASSLRNIGRSLRAGKSETGHGEEFTREAPLLIKSIREGKWPGASAFFLALTQDATWQMEALAGQIRSATRLAGKDEFLPPTPARSRSLAISGWQRRFQNQLAILRANLTLRSVSFQHALRLAVCVAVGDAIGRGFDFQRSYWIPMTIAIILKPDFLSTFSRGALRLAGTFVGLILATLIFHALPSGAVTDSVLVGLFTLLLRWVGPANYGIFTVAISALVVALIAGTGTSPIQVILLRGFNTAVGGTLGMLAYAVWPTWERTHYREALARLLDAYRDYLRTLRTAYWATGTPDFREIDRVRQAARVARSNAEASVDRLRAEPGDAPLVARSALAMLASSHDFIYAAMTLEVAVLESNHKTPDDRASLGPLTRFLDQVELTLYFLSAVLRDAKLEAKDMPNLREQHTQLIKGLGGEQWRYSLTQLETDRMTNALNTLREQVLAGAPESELTDIVRAG